MDFEAILEAALRAGLGQAKAGGKAAEKWMREMAKAHEGRLEMILRAMSSGEISKETGAVLIRDSADAMRAEAATLTIIARAAAQGAVNAFVATLRSGVSAALKIAI